MGAATFKMVALFQQQRGDQRDNGRGAEQEELKASIKPCFCTIFPIATMAGWVASA
jgi:hypothetical protein